MAGSLAVMTDAAHLLTDIAAFILAILANKVMTLPPSREMTYGMVRAEVLSAMFSTLMIWLLTGGLVWEAVNRIIAWFLGEAEVVQGPLMTGIAVVGLVVNIIQVFILSNPWGDKEEGTIDASTYHGHDHGHAEPSNPGAGTKRNGDLESGSAAYGSIQEETENKGDNLNVKAALLHALTDGIQSLGVILAGVIICFKPHWQVVDPMCTILFACLVVASTIRLLKKTVFVLMEAVPESTDWHSVYDRFSAIRGVSDVHDLHIWSLTLGTTAVTAHIKASDPHQALKDAHVAARELGLQHVTIQVQQEDLECPCGQ